MGWLFPACMEMTEINENSPSPSEAIPRISRRRPFDCPVLFDVAMMSLVCVGVCICLTTYTYIITVARGPSTSSFPPLAAQRL